MSIQYKFFTIPIKKEFRFQDSGFFQVISDFYNAVDNGSIRNIKNASEIMNEENGHILF